MKPVQAGKYRKRVYVQQLTEPPTDLAMADPYNAPPSPLQDSNWGTTVVRWAEVLPLTGRELFQGQQVRQDVTHRVTMRWFRGAPPTGSYLPAVNPKMRLQLNGRTLQIASVINVEERNVELVLMCREEVSDQ